jgi:hypothetical protein
MLLKSVRAAFAVIRRRPRILCHTNHYFGTTSRFVGKSTAGQEEVRAGIVRSALAGLRALPFDMDICVCGLPDCSLVPIDLNVDVSDPQHIVYASIERMFDALDSYDYFLNVEDDILVSEEVLASCMAFQASSRVNEVYLPNRMEIQPDGSLDCVDLIAEPGWKTAPHRTFLGTALGVANNPHSGLSFLSRDQMRYAAERVDLSSRDLIIGGLMASAYANLHAPFLMWRAQSAPLAHHVLHLDKWLAAPPGAPNKRTPAPAAPDSCPAGYLDDCVREGPFVKLAGWAIVGNGTQATEFRVDIDGHDVGSDELRLNRIERPDVADVYPHAHADCGFELLFPARTLFAWQDAAAPMRMGFAFRSEPDEDFWSLPEAATTRALDGIAAAIATLPNIPDIPFMPEPVRDRLLALMQTADTYLEYGTGGTTMQAQRVGVPTIIAVESDALWLDGVRHKSEQAAGRSRFHFVHVDIGPTGEWGYPVSEARWSGYHHYALRAWELCQEQGLSPDVVLIDGRFRMACFLASLLFGKPGCRIIVDDYLDRPYYAAMERFVVKHQMVDRAAEFVVPPDLPRHDLLHALFAAVTDPR